VVFFKGWEPPADSAVLCAFCRRPAPLAGPVRCRRCRVVYHPDCWTANSSRCAIYGCEPGVAARTPERTPAPARSGGGGQYGWLLVVVIMAVVRAVSSSHHVKPSRTPIDNLHLNRDWNVHQQITVPPDFRNLQMLDVDGELEGTVASYTRAIERNAFSQRAWEGRAYLRYDQGAWAESLGDFRMALSLGSTREDYLRLRIWLLQAKMGERNAADQELSELLKSRNALYAGVWEHQIAEYLACTRPENDLLIKAGNRIQECQAFFYIGSRRLVDGDADGAREFFGRCADTHQDNFREYRSAVAELERLR
jgi:hypothetical protein